MIVANLRCGVQDRTVHPVFSVDIHWEFVRVTVRVSRVFPIKRPLPCYHNELAADYGGLVHATSNTKQSYV